MSLGVRNEVKSDVETGPPLVIERFNAPPSDVREGKQKTASNLIERDPANREKKVNSLIVEPLRLNKPSDRL